MGVSHVNGVKNSNSSHYHVNQIQNSEVIQKLKFNGFLWVNVRPLTKMIHGSKSHKV